MIRNLIERPIAVSMTLIAIIILGFVSTSLIPVSLMPDVDIPQITVHVSVPGTGAREVDASYVKPLRQQFMQLPALKDISTESTNGHGKLFLKFDHGSDIDFLFIEVNEKIDRTGLSKEIDRPRVIKASATDIPAFYINITPRDSSKLLELSVFASQIISKRIEQISEVAIVDISGMRFPEYLIVPDNAKLTSLGLTSSILADAINRNNLALGNLTIREGEYQWNIRFRSEINSIEDIEAIRININGRIYPFTELAEVREIPQPTDCIVRSNGFKGLTMAVVKQSDAKMSDLNKEISKTLKDFEKEYPEVIFDVTRDQTQLLSYSIDNLKSNIIIGALMACFILFFFMKDFRSPLLISLTIPLALIISLLFFYIFNISINIISLSGLILGLGMMVDNSIIVIDNMSQRWQRGEPLKSAVIKGAGEVFAPMLSSVLTTCAVFVPLVFLSGIAGALFYDQAMAISISLFSSLFVSVLVIPVYYYALYKNKTPDNENRYIKKIVSVFGHNKIYEKTLQWVFRHQGAVIVMLLALIPMIWIFYNILPKSSLPPLTHDDSIVMIDWNRSISVEDNDLRAKRLMDHVREDLLEETTLIGVQQFLMSHSQDMERSEAMLYIKAENQSKLFETEEKIKQYLIKNYPEASFSITEAANLFNLIFSEREAPLVARVKGTDGRTPDPDQLNYILEQIETVLPDTYFEPVLWQEQILFIIDQQMLALYDVNISSIYNVLEKYTAQNRVFSINVGSYYVPVILGDDHSFSDDMLLNRVRNQKGVDIPLNLLMKETRSRDLKSIISGVEGDYYPVNINVDSKDIKKTMTDIDKLAHDDNSFEVTYSGSYFSNNEMIKELIIVFIVAVFLLYFILAAQFESLVQPLIILSEIVVDVSGAFFFLWLFGSGINLMSLIGIVVMCGIIINDSILKVDTINKLRKEGYSLLRSVVMGSHRRLKPIVMTSLTTILAILPFMFRGNMGSDLQFPLSVALVGGMIIGTIVSVFAIPLFYYLIYKNRVK